MHKFQPDPSANRAPIAIDGPKPARQLRKLRNDVLIAVAVKALAILILGFVFFGPSQRPHITPQAIFSASPAGAPANE
jgi:hypothetical protein